MYDEAITKAELTFNTISTLTKMISRRRRVDSRSFAVEAQKAFMGNLASKRLATSESIRLE